MIECIEGLEPELKAHIFFDRDPLVQSEIKAVVSRPLDDTDGGRAKGELRRPNERGLVDPIHYGSPPAGAIDCIGVTDQIRPAAARIRDVNYVTRRQVLATQKRRNPL